MNIGGIITNDLANGPGIRTSVFVTGCHLHCLDCQNKELQDFNAGVPVTDEIIKKIIDSLTADGIKKNLSILGGEPLSAENQEGVAYLLKKVKEAIPNTKVWLWTGYDLDVLLNAMDKFPEPLSDLQKILTYVDVIVDGAFISPLKYGKHIWRGSANQRIMEKIDDKGKTWKIIN